MRPGSFGLLAHTNYGPMTPAHTIVPLPAAPYDPDPDAWPELHWFDGGSGRALRLVDADPVRDVESFADALTGGEVPVKTLGAVLERFRERPEHKSLGPDGLLAGPGTRGLLLRRGIESGPELTELRGKEGHGLAERTLGLLPNPGKYGNAYGLRAGDPFRDLVPPVLRAIGVIEAARRTGLSRWAIQRAIRDEDNTNARQATKQALTCFASDHAARAIRARGHDPPKDPLARLFIYSAEGLGTNVCAFEGCSALLSNGQARYCSSQHKQAAWRRRLLDHDGT
jgi:hypothetical protein